MQVTENKAKILNFTLIASNQLYPVKPTYIHTHTHTHLFNGPFSGTIQVSRYQNGKTNLDFSEARNSEWQGISWAIHKAVPAYRQITTPAPHHSVFYRPDALPAAQPTASKHYARIVSM